MLTEETTHTKEKGEEKEEEEETRRIDNTNIATFVYFKCFCILQINSVEQKIPKENKAKK